MTEAPRTPRVVLIPLLEKFRRTPGNTRALRQNWKAIILLYRRNPTKQKITSGFRIDYIDIEIEL